MPSRNLHPRDTALIMRGNNSNGSPPLLPNSRFGKRLPTKRSSELLLLIFAVLLCLVLAASVMSALRSPPLDKARLVDAALNAGVFEMPVATMPVLRELFKEYEKSRKLAVRNITMSQYDASCEPYYRDSVAATASFDRDFYSEREHLYKVVYRNRTGALKEEVCDSKAPLGCCTACRVADCCFCRYDGKEDVAELLQANEPLLLKSKITRGFSLLESEEAKTLSGLYGEALESLGYAAARGSREYQAMVWVKNFSYLPPGGFLMWHTNRYDNNVVSYRYSENLSLSLSLFLLLSISHHFLSGGLSSPPLLSGESET